MNHVSFNSKNLDKWNRRSQYLVTHHNGNDSVTIGVAFHTGTVWQLLHHRCTRLSELKKLIRHKYTGSKID